MRRLKWLIREAHRRSLWQVMGFYLAGSWMALQVVETLTTSLGLPDWVPAASVALLVVGFPIVTGTAVVQEGGPSREEDDEPPSEPATSGDVGLSLEPAAPSAAQGAPEPSLSGLQRVLSWPNSLLGGAVAFSLLGLVTALYMGSRLLGIGPAAPLVAKGMFDERQPIVLAEFESATGDSLLALSATEALRIDLSQSTVVRLVEPDRVGTALRRMGHLPDTPLTRTVARELAVREGLQAVIGGELNRAGGGYMISAQVIASGGSILTSHRVSAADSTEIIAAIDELSRALRTKIGESIKSVRASPPLARVTTTSLEALRKYSQAEHAVQVQGQQDRAVSLLEEAIALDSTFAMAWRKLGIILFNQNESPELQRRAITRSYELRDRLSEVERYHAEGAYHLALTEDPARAITAYENLLQVDPDNSSALNNLGWIYSRRYSDGVRAESFYRDAAQRDSSDVLVRLNLWETQVTIGKLKEARATLDEADQLVDESPSPRHLRARANLSVIEGRYEAAHAAIDQWLGLHTDDPGQRAWSEVHKASLYAARGRMDEAATRIRASIRTLDPVEQRGAYAWHHLWLAGLHLYVGGDTARALDRMGRVSGEEFLDDLGWDFTVDLIGFYADAGQPERARGYLGRLRDPSPDEDDGSPSELVIERRTRDTLVARGAISLSEGDPEVALRHFRDAEPERPDRDILGWLGIGYDRAGITDSAVAYLERYLGTYAPDQLIGDGHHLARLVHRLGELHDDRGEVEEALEHYRRYVALWNEADPELQGRVDEIRRRIEALEMQGSVAADRDVS